VGMPVWIDRKPWREVFWAVLHCGATLWMGIAGIWGIPL
jgi:hypothetical protein